MLRKPQSTRLTRTSEKQNKRQTIIFTIGTILVLFALFQFGPIFINTFGTFVDNFRGTSSESNQETETILINPPVLKNVPQATKETFISFSGTAPQKDGTVEIYRNDELIDEIKIGNDMNFDVEDISLKSGQNIIKARFVSGKNSSPFSDGYNVRFIKDEPKLEISNPTDNATFTKADKNIFVRGKTDPENTITINGFRAIVEPDGEFSYQYMLNDGENTLDIEAKNVAGVSVKKTIKVTYSP